MASFSDYSKTVNGVTITGAYDTATGRALDGNITSKYGTASASYFPEVEPYVPPKLSLNDYAGGAFANPIVPPGMAVKPKPPVLPTEIIRPPASALALTAKPATPPAPSPMATFTSEPGETFTPVSPKPASPVTGTGVGAASSFGSTNAEPQTEINPYTRLAKAMDEGRISLDEAMEYKRQLDAMHARYSDDPHAYLDSLPPLSLSSQRFYQRKTLRVGSQAVISQLGRRTRRGAQSSLRNGTDPAKRVMSTWGSSWNNYQDPLGPRRRK